MQFLYDKPKEGIPSFRDANQGRFHTQKTSFYNREKIQFASRALMEDHLRANSWIGEDSGLSMQTIEKLRAKMERDGLIEKTDTFITRDGRKYPRKIKTS